jgi:hypothetical protein
MPVVYSIQDKLRTSKKNCRKEWLVPVPHIKLSTDVRADNGSHAWIRVNTRMKKLSSNIRDMRSYGEF